MGLGKSEAHPNPCSAFHILVVNADDEEKFVAFMSVLTWATPAAGKFNICKYTMTVPTNKPLRVYARFEPVGDLSNEQSNELWAFYAKRGCSGGEKIRHWSTHQLIDPEPEPGMARTFTGPKTVILGTKASYVAFEMYYWFLHH